jgi:hypothetical protein
LLLDTGPRKERKDGRREDEKKKEGRRGGWTDRPNEWYREGRRLISRFNTIDESKRMCPHLYVQHVATYRNGESEAGYWGEVDPKSHKVSFSLFLFRQGS